MSYNFVPVESPLAISNFFISKSLETGVELTPMKLVKLVYISHGWYLGFTDEALLPEAVEAWQYGPVVPTVYHKFKLFGNGQINSMVSEYDAKSSYLSYPTVKAPNVIGLLNQVWDVYGKYDGVELSSLTHEPGTPWDITWNKHGGKHQVGAIIPNALIKAHYKQKIDAEPAAPAN